MRKINTLFASNSQLEALVKNVQAHQRLQQLWQAAAPIILTQASFACSLTNNQLTVYADSALVANKIKLTQASLLKQLGNVQMHNPIFRECKITAIIVKLQVKSRSKAIIIAPRTLSSSAANNLKVFAQNLLVKNKGESPLATKLKLLASKAK